MGWRVSSSRRTDFVLDALEQVPDARQPERDGILVCHSDRSSQYVSIPYTERLPEADIKPSAGSKGNCFDNAVIESFFGTLKAEYFHLAMSSSVEVLESGVHDYIRYYNYERI